MSVNRNRLEISIITALVVGSLVAMACAASTRHVVVTVDNTAYETLADVHNLEQRALCGLPSCAGSTVENTLPGWTLAKSQKFNQLLLPGVRGGQKLNQLLAQLGPGKPMPADLSTTIQSIGASLTAVINDFPPGTTRSQLIQDLAVIQQAVLDGVNLVLAAKGGN